MKKNDLVKLLDTLGIAPSKKLGQNFLIDEQFIDWIVRTADIRQGEHIIEVGPGLGALTGRMLDAGADLTAIEFDRKLAEYMRKTLVPRGLKLIEGDACRVDFEKINGPGEEFRLISNLPYSAGTIVIANLLDLPLPPKEMFVMLQKEVGQRFAAGPGTEDYSALTARLAAVYDSRIIKTIPPDLFYPRPEIVSCIIRMTRRETYPDFELRKILSRLTRTAFAHRRKKMFRQTASVFGEEPLKSAMETVGIDLDIRAERITPEQFLRMAENLRKG